MIDEAVLKEALTILYDREGDYLEKMASTEKPCNFTRSYYSEMQQISKKAGHCYVTMMHRRLRLAVVAAALVVLMVTATVTAIAIVKPQIFYNLIARSEIYEYRFKQKGTGKNILEFEFKKPIPPEGYEIVEEEKDEDMFSYRILYENENGDYIDYDQESPVNLSINVPYNGKRKTVKVNGYTGELFRQEETRYLLFEDGYYVYTLSGNCTEAELIEMAKTIR